MSEVFKTSEEYNGTGAHIFDANTDSYMLVQDYGKSKAAKEKQIRGRAKDGRT